MTKKNDFASINKRFTKTIVEELTAASQHSAVLVEAPPGAGKSTLTCSVAHAIATADKSHQLAVITQTNEQADDIVSSLHQRHPDLKVGRLISETRGASSAMRDLASGSRSITVSDKLDDASIRSSRIVVATASKWDYVRQGHANPDSLFPIGLIDEAYQMRADLLMNIACMFEVLLCVGDPGQLDPFAEIDDSIWKGLRYSPTRSAMSVLQSYHPDLAVHRLPRSWRLPPSAASLVSSAFYPNGSFEAGTQPGDRKLHFKRPLAGSKGHVVNDALNAAAASGWAYIELPERFTIRRDDEIAAHLAMAAREALNRQGALTDERDPGGRTLEPGNIAIIAAHNDQVDAVRQQLYTQGTDPDSLTVSTANRIQGREYDLVLVWHPLAGRRDATPFHLEPGRMCVMLSRHRHGCIVVGRAGSQRLLDEFPDSDPIYLDEPETFPDGWGANHQVLTHLLQHRV